jgi:yeast amino acid transporter
MLLFTCHALGELAVMYPINGAFYTYSVRFIDPGWGFAMGVNYAFNWLIVLPFELVASSITLQFWSDKLPNMGIFIAIFLVLVVVINIFGVRGYGEVEFVLGTIKVIAILGFILLGIIINCGGVPTDNRGYIGGKYWS